MQEITRYKCELCGEVFEDKAKCEKCEKKHSRPVRITGISYNYLSRYPIFPDRIQVEMEDGTKKFYKVD